MFASKVYRIILLKEYLTETDASLYLITVSDMIHTKMHNAVCSKLRHERPANSATTYK